MADGLEATFICVGVLRRSVDYQVKRFGTLTNILKS